MNETAPTPIDEKSELMPEESPNKAEPKGGNAVIYWISGIALLASLMLLFGGIWLWSQYQHLLQTQQQVAQTSSQSLMSLQKDLTNLNTRMETGVIAKVEAIKADQVAMEAAQQRLNRSVDAVKALAAPEQQGWALAEAEYLIRVANHRLIFREDPDTAIDALSAADERLRELNDPAVLEVRTVLAWEISSLKTLPRPDIEGMALTLSSLASLSDSLPLPGADARIVKPDNNDQANAAPKTETDRSVEDAMDKVWDNMRKLVVIRKTGDAKPEILSPKESYFLRENLSIKIQAARLNLLQRSASAYQQDLSTARKWTKRYFQKDSPQVQHVLQELQRLASIDITRPKPDISGSLRKVTLLQAHLAGKQEGERIVQEMKAAQPPLTNTNTDTSAEVTQ